MEVNDLHNNSLWQTEGDYGIQAKGRMILCSSSTQQGTMNAIATIMVVYPAKKCLHIIAFGARVNNLFHAESIPLPGVIAISGQNKC